MKIITQSELKKLEREAKATNKPEKRTEYAKAKREFNELRDALFDGQEYPYAKSPSDQYVEQLRQEAEKNNDEVSRARYEMMKANRDTVDANKSGETSRNFKQEQARLQKIAREDGEVTDADLKSAWEVTSKNPSPELLKTYSILKRKKENQDEGSEG